MSAFARVIASVLMVIGIAVAGLVVLLIALNPIPTWASPSVETRTYTLNPPMAALLVFAVILLGFGLAWMWRIYTRAFDE